MSGIEYTDQSVWSSEITHTFPAGKNDDNYAKIKDESIEDNFETIMNARQQSDDKTSAIHAAIMKIKSELKLLCSLQVHNSDESLSSIFNPNLHLSSSSFPDHTTLEPSFELPFDSISLEEIINNSQLSPTFDDNSPSDLFIEQFLSSNLDMTFKELTDMSIEQNDQFYANEEMTTDFPSTAHDEVTISSVDSTSDDNDRDDVNRRGMKKSGGPIRKLARFGNKQVIKYSNEYHDRRIKNNEAVKKSRSKAKEKQKETEGKMTQLSRENRTLSDRVDLLMKELQVLKSLYKELNQDFPPTAVKALERVNVR